MVFSVKLIIVTYNWRKSMVFSVFLVHRKEDEAEEEEEEDMDTEWINLRKSRKAGKAWVVSVKFNFGLKKKQEKHWFS